MQTNILQYLISSAARNPLKTAVTDGDRKLSYSALLEKSRAAGTALAHIIKPLSPVGIYMSKLPLP